MEEQITNRRRNQLRKEIEKKLLRIENQYDIKILDWNFLLGGKNGIWRTNYHTKNRKAEQHKL